MEKERKCVTEKELSIKPLSRREVEKAALDRVSKIDKEFKKGFDFIKNHPKSVTFFGSARFDENNEFYKQARSIAGKIATELKYSVVTGGGPGIMEAANRGAFEAGGVSLGIGIELPHEQSINKYVTDFIELYYFFVRKVILTYSAESYVFLPGGFGTLDEFFEIVTLVQTKKIESVPVILVGKKYWEPLKETIEKELLGRKTIDAEDMNLFHITDDEDEVIEIIKNAPVRVEEDCDHCEVGE